MHENLKIFFTFSSGSTIILVGTSQSFGCSEHVNFENFVSKEEKHLRE